MDKNKVNKIINIDESVIDELLTRSVGAIYPSKEELKKVLLSGRKLKIYVGADATGPNLHIGHSTNFLLLEKFRKLGHKVIILFGDFTAMIGDPTDKNAERVSLSSKQVKENIKTWKKQIAPIFKSSFFDSPKIVKNSRWLSKLNLADIIKLSSNFTVQQMIERDMFQKRLEEKKPISLSEFIYPLLQGYDSVALDVDMEIGGSDQTFNMLAGRNLQRKINNKEKFVITTTLLENPRTGKKLMNKSEGNLIGLMDSPENMFGKTMALPDETIVSVLTDCTLMTLSEIENIKKGLEEGKNPRDSKIVLAETLVSMYHGAEKSQMVSEAFKQTFSEGKIPENIEEIEAGKDFALSEILLQAKLIKSKGEFTRLVREGAIMNIQTEEKVTDIFAKIGVGGTFRIGKHRFIKILTSD